MQMGSLKTTKNKDLSCQTIDFLMVNRAGSAVCSDNPNWVIDWRVCWVICVCEGKSFVCALSIIGGQLWDARSSVWMYMLCVCVCVCVWRNPSCFNRAGQTEGQGGEGRKEGEEEEEEGYPVTELLNRQKFNRRETDREKERQTGGAERERERERERASKCLVSERGHSGSAGA